MENIIQKHRAFVAGQIQKSFDSNLQSSGEEVEKAWNVGDEKQYLGVTWYVGGFNAKGQPLWRKKKDEQKSDGEKKFKENFKNASNDVLQKIIDGKIQAGDKEKKWTTDIINERKKSGKSEAANKIDDTTIDQAEYDSQLKMAKQVIDYSNLTFDEAVKIGESHISNEEKSSISNEPLRYLQEDIKNHKYDDDIKYQESELRRAVNMKIGDKNFMAPNHIVTPEFKSEEIKKYANRLAAEKERAELCKKALAKRKAEKKQLLDSSGNDFTEDEARLYISKFRPKDESNAVVKNTWNTLMGRIGSTSATISVGKGKFKEFSTYNTPDWRPLGVYSYSTMGWDGKYIKITGVVQSWKEVKDCLSDTENMTISIYKHPKQ